MERKPYFVIKSRYVTEKATLLQSLQTLESNPSLRRMNRPKCVFLVDKSANKREIALAIEFIYREKKVKVVGVNTIRMKPKPKKMRGRKGSTSLFKKAIVTFAPGDSLEEDV